MLRLIGNAPIHRKADTSSIPEMKFPLKSWFADRCVKLICRVTPHCHEMTRLISQAKEEKLPLVQRLRMRLHYRICIWCERYRDQLETLRTASREFPEKVGEISTERLSEDSKARLKKALQKSE